MAADLSFFVDKRIFLMPKEEHFFVVYEARSRENLLQHLEIIKTLARGVELGVELHAIVFAGGLVGFEYGFQTTLDEVDVIVVVADFDALRFGGFRHAVDADGEELFVQRDKACIVNGQHSGGLVFFHQFAVGVLVFVDFDDFGGKVAPVLFQSVHVDGDDYSDRKSVV